MSCTNLLDIISGVDTYPYERDVNSSDPIHNTTPFIFESTTIGNILPMVVLALVEYNKAQLTAPFVINKTITFSPSVDTFEKRTLVIKELMDTWRKRKTFDCLKGWRNEAYPVYGDCSEKDVVVFTMERAASQLLGVATFGAHINVFVRQPDGSVDMWVAKRALTKPTWPGLLDNCVAGGLSYGDTLKDCVVKECNEEASIPMHIANKATRAGCIYQYTYTDTSILPETQYTYDLELPANVVPEPQDEEVESFYLWPLDKVKKTILQGLWKVNSAMVAIEFLMRYGAITRDNDPYYADIDAYLHRDHGFPAPKRTIE
ncbi:NUDIX hydrolase domain-like protein [Spinellus fusiger]|nr:NUDIX hydrolase domain-like protein [Spinellus fusiger]